MLKKKRKKGFVKKMGSNKDKEEKRSPIKECAVSVYEESYHHLLVILKRVCADRDFLQHSLKLPMRF